MKFQAKSMGTGEFCTFVLAAGVDWKWGDPGGPIAMKDLDPHRLHSQVSPSTRSSTHSRIHTVRIALAVMIWGLACGNEAPSVTGAAGTGTEPANATLPISGIYEVSGTTVDLESGQQREITGRVMLDERGATYSANFDLKTLFPTDDGNLEAEVIGTGGGSIDGRTLTGNAETQIVISQVPGVDPRFAFVPRNTTKRIVSSSVTTVAADGTVDVRIESRPAEGEVYSPTRTKLSGVRVGDVAIGGGQESQSDRPFGEASD